MKATIYDRELNYKKIVVNYTIDKILVENNETIICYKDNTIESYNNDKYYIEIETN
jgi:hypothetical protein